MGSYIRNRYLLRRLISSFSSATSFPLYPTSSSAPISPRLWASSLSFSSQSTHETDGPTSLDYRSLLEEDEFHRLADRTIHQLQEKFEEFGDDVQIEGFDVDYGNQVLTLKVGHLGTYVINKQTPNRQIWLSSPVSGPSRFDWDRSKECWLYRRTEAELLHLLEEEFSKFCDKPITLS